MICLRREMTNMLVCQTTGISPNILLSLLGGIVGRMWETLIKRSLTSLEDSLRSQLLMCHLLLLSLLHRKLLSRSNVRKSNFQCYLLLIEVLYLSSKNYSCHFARSTHLLKAFTKTLRTLNLYTCSILTTCFRCWGSSVSIWSHVSCSVLLADWSPRGLYPDEEHHQNGSSSNRFVWTSLI